VHSLPTDCDRKLAESGLLVTTSWDDGHPSDLRVAELLDKHRLKGTFYVPRSNCEGRAVMSCAEIVSLASRFEIGGHTQDHVSLTELAPRVASEQIQSNKRWLEDVLGQRVRGFAYVRGRHNRVVRDLVQKAGYDYARTVKNLMSEPGVDRMEVPTTMQFFNHAPGAYLRNYVSGGPSVARLAILGTALATAPLPARLLRAAETCASLGGHFHLWGHSWEVDEHDLWRELDILLGNLSALGAVYVSNADWRKTPNVAAPSYSN